MGRLITAVLMFVLVFWGTTFAEGADALVLRVNGAKIKPDVDPVQVEGRILVPVRFIAEALGVPVKWDEKSSTVIIGSEPASKSSFRNNTGEIKLVVNGNVISADVPTQSVNGRVMVPVRFVAEALNCRVGWVESQNMVTITDSKLTIGNVNIHPASGVGQKSMDLLKDYAGKAYTKVSMNSGVPKDKYYNVFIYPDRRSFVEEMMEFMDIPREQAEKYTCYYIKPNVVCIDLTRTGTDTGNSLVWAFLGLEGVKTDPHSLPEKFMVLPGEKEWQSFNTSYFKIFYCQDEAYVKDVSEKLDRIYKGVIDQIGHRPTPMEDTGLVPVYFYDHEDLKKYLNTRSPVAGLWKGRSMYINLIFKEYESEPLMKQTYRNYLYCIFKHELIHGATIGSRDLKAKNIPVWFKEGVSTYHQNEPPFKVPDDSDQVLIRAIRLKNLMSWDMLSNSSDKWVGSEGIGYTQAASAWEYLSNTYGEKKIIEIFYTEGEFKDIINKVTGKTLKELEKDWYSYAVKKYLN